MGTAEEVFIHSRRCSEILVPILPFNCLHLHLLRQVLLQLPLLKEMKAFLVCGGGGFTKTSIKPAELLSRFLSFALFTWLYFFLLPV